MDGLVIAGRANALLTGLGVRTNGNSVLKGLLGAQGRRFALAESRVRFANPSRVKTWTLYANLSARNR